MEAEKEKREDESVEKGAERKDGQNKGLGENKDMKRNGSSHYLDNGRFLTCPTDDRWLEWLDSKIALLINRNGVDPRDYGGKSGDE